MSGVHAWLYAYMTNDALEFDKLEIEMRLGSLMLVQVFGRQFAHTRAIAGTKSGEGFRSGIGRDHFDTLCNELTGMRMILCLHV